MPCRNLIPVPKRPRYRRGLPDKDGIETIQELQRDFPAVKILAVSGGTSSGKVYLLDIARRLGAARILRKPFGRKILLDNVQELLDEIPSP